MLTLFFRQKIMFLISHWCNHWCAISKKKFFFLDVSRCEKIVQIWFSIFDSVYRNSNICRIDTIGLISIEDNWFSYDWMEMIGRYLNLFFFFWCVWFYNKKKKRDFLYKVVTSCNIFVSMKFKNGDFLNKL